MACEEVGEFLICSKPQSDGGTVWWDVGGGTIWSIPVGTVGEWVTAVVAAGAVWFASRASARANALSAQIVELEEARERRTEHVELERRDAAARGEQADHIAAWLDAVQVQGIVCWEVANGGGLPIYNVVLRLIRPGDRGPLFEDHHDMVRPGGVYELTGRPHPEGSGKFLVPVEEWEPGWATTHRVAIEFDDTAGRRWLRDEDGRLRLLSTSITIKRGEMVAKLVARGDIRFDG